MQRHLIGSMQSEVLRNEHQSVDKAQFRNLNRAFVVHLHCHARERSKSASWTTTRGRLAEVRFAYDTLTIPAEDRPELRGPLTLHQLDCANRSSSGRRRQRISAPSKMRMSTETQRLVYSCSLLAEQQLVLYPCNCLVPLSNSLAPVDQAAIDASIGVRVRRRHRTGNQGTSPRARKKPLRKKNPMTSQRKCAIQFSKESGRAV